MKNLLVLLYLVVFNISMLIAQCDGVPDLTFNPSDIGNGYGDGANGVIYALALQSDGKVLIGGDFTSYNGTARNRIARLNADGSLDPTFTPGTGANNYISAISLQSDGKILIGGNFTSYNGTGRNRIARLNADGSLDPTFTPGTGANGEVHSISLQSDGKILIGGHFTSYNGTARNYIARLNANGSLDPTFTPGTGANGEVRSISLQSDGKVLIGGWFTSYNGTGRNFIARLNADGSLDATFNPGTGANSGIYAIALQSDGKVLIGGNFTSYNDTGRNRIARLNANGSLDPTFNPGTGANNTIYAIALQSDGKVLIGGTFTNYNGIGRNRIARIAKSIDSPTTSSVTHPTCAISTGSFDISNFNASYTYTVYPSAGTSVSSTGRVTAPAGTYMVTATLGSCISTPSASVTINPQPTTLPTPAIGSITHPTCTTATGSFDITNHNTSYTYTLSPSAGTSISTTGTVTAPPGSYTLTATLGSCISTPSASVTINPQPAPPNNNISVSTITGTITAVETGASYQWYECPNTLLPGETNRSFTVPASGGTYKVEITSGTCTVSSACITIEKKGASFNTSSYFSCHPNPAEDRITLSGLLPIEHAEVLDVAGKLVMHFTPNAEVFSIELSGLAPSVYVLKVWAQDKTEIIKVVKQ
ncbi:MAG: T9SS type A sorting domain-containing protein [Cytophagaceae bacterium]|nr:T9SS type A sorting domain-containing protein [Cytophagaceae bacterium]MDW8455678.1 T9SS type A sorting domain-containing protein [Cytophagaceae bacterium]